jgi:putative ABC transport system permease protein
MNMQITLAWRYLAGRKLRNTLTTLAIFFGVTIIVGLGALAPALKDTLAKSVAASSMNIDLLITHNAKGYFDASLVDKIVELPGVIDGSGLISRNLYLPSGAAMKTAEGGQVSTLEVYGLDLDTGRGLYAIVLSEGRQLKQGRLPQAGDGNVIVISQPLADGIGLKSGDFLNLPAASGTARFEIVGILSDYGVILGVEQVFMPLKAAQDLFNTPAQVNAIAAQYAPGADQAAVKEAVLDSLGEGYQIGSIGAGGDAFSTVLQMIDVIFTMFGALTLAMAGFIMFNTFQTVVVERRHDIGMLRAIGAPRRTIMNLVLLESLIQGVLGTTTGLLAGLLLAKGVVPLLNPVWERLLHAQIGQPVFTVQILVIAVVLGLGIPVLSAVLPARSAVRITPLEALQPAIAGYNRRSVGKRALLGGLVIALALLTLLTGNLGLSALGALCFLVGLVLVGPALVYPIAEVFGRFLTLIFAREGQIAKGNLIRQPNRSAITASSMTISLAIIVALTGLTSTIRNGMLGYLDLSLKADYLLLPENLVLGEGNVGAGPELVQSIREIPGVQSVTSLRRAEALVDGAKTQLIGVDPISYPQISGLYFTAGNPEQAYQRIETGRAAIINGIFAFQYGIKIGDQLNVQTTHGPRSYDVAGIGLDFINAKQATIYLSHANLAEDFNSTNDQIILLNLSAGVDKQAAENALLNIAGDYPSFGVVSFDKLREAQLINLGSLTSGLYSVMLLLAIPSLLALTNTLGINILERTREIGMLRAVGATRRQVRRLITAESLLLVAMGAAFGILAGIWLGAIMVGSLSFTGLPMPYYFPFGGIVLAIAAGMLFGVLAAIIPARRAARLDIIQALAYE